MEKSIDPTLEFLLRLATVVDPAQVVEAAAAACLSLLNAPGCRLYAWKPADDRLEALGGAGETPPASLAGVPAAGLRPLLDGSREFSLEDPGSLASAVAPAPAALLLALNTPDGESPAGGLIQLWKAAAAGQPAFDEMQIAVACLLARQTAAALQRAGGEAALHQAVLSLHSANDAAAILATLLESAFALAPGLRRAQIFLLETGRLKFHSERWAGGNSQPPGEPRPDETAHLALRSRRRIERLDHRAGDTRLAAPVELNGRAYGVLHLSFTAPRRPPPGFGELLTRLTEQAAAALHSAGRLETARRQANTDPLTGAPNRRALFERLENELRRASRYQRPFTLFMLDLNDFKRINDTHGHPAGDRALQQVAECLRQGLRETDFFARYGGDEFTILLPETDAATARSLADRLLERLRDCPIDLSGRVGALSISLGMASFPQDGVTLAGLIIAADRALYEVKFQRNAKLERSGRRLE